MGPHNLEPPAAILVGGVAQLYQGDLDVGRVAAENLAAESLPPGVLVEDFHYGAVAVAQRLEDIRPRSLVLVGAAERGRMPGSVHRRRILPPDLPPDCVGRSIAEAVTGYVTIDLVIEVAAGLGALPGRTVTIELEPSRTGFSEHLSAAAQAGLKALLQLTRAEIRRAPLLELAERLHGRDQGGRLRPAPALDVLRELLREIAVLDAEGHWGASFALRDRLRRDITEGRTGEGMDHLDWVLWWALIEELDRLQALESLT